MRREKQIEEMAEEILQEYTRCYSEADKDVLEKMLNKLVCDVAAEIFAEVRQLLESSTIIKSSDFSQPYFDMFYFKKCLINLEKKYNESEVAE